MELGGEGGKVKKLLETHETPRVLGCAIADGQKVLSPLTSAMEKVLQ